MKTRRPINCMLKSSGSDHGPALCGYCKYSHIVEYAALSKTPRVLADDPMLVFQHHVRGFVLIELVMTLILIGFIGAFTGFFLSKGIEGFIASKRNSEVALKAQIALDRISAELRHVTEVTNWSGTSFTYKCQDFPGTTRKLVFDTAAHEIRLSINNGPELVLVDELDTYTLARDVGEIDRASDGKEEIKSITAAFTLKDVGRLFRVVMFPRHLVTKPA